MALRSYQEQAIESVLTDWRDGHQAVLLHMATGTGKTQVYLGLVDRVLREEPDARAMVIAHTMELVEQPVDRLRQFWPDLGRKAGIVMAERNDAAAQIISATVQTISNPARFAAAVAAGPIKYLVTDEAHHAVASTYRKVYEMMDRYCPGWKHVGVTATPMRSDGEALAQVFGKLSYRYTIKDGVVEKWLVPPRWLAIKTGISLAGVPTSRSGDYVGKRLADVFETDNCFDLVVESHQKFGGGRKAIAFVQTVAGAYRLAEVFNAAGIAAEAADGKTPKDERAAVLKRFRRGETRVLVNCALYTEGVDVPDIELIHQVRPTKSNSRYVQMIGRGLRPVPGKSDCLILDYAPAEWRDIVMLGDVLGLNKSVVEATKQVEVPDDEVELVDDDVLAGFTYDGEAKGLLGDPLELVSRALNYLEMSPWSWHHGTDGWMTVGLGSDYKGTERILAIEPPDEDGNCRLWKIGRRAGERYWQAQLGESGEFEAISAVAEEIISRYSTPILAEKKRRWRADPPTQGQVNWGRAMGIKGIESMSKGQASDAITHALALRAIRRAM